MAEEAHRNGARAPAVRADTADVAQMRAMVEQVVAELGGVDILVNNAGTQSRVPCLELPVEEWRRVLGTNLDGYFLVGQAVARKMVAAGQGGVNVNDGNVMLDPAGLAPG